MVRKGQLIGPERSGFTPWRVVPPYDSGADSIYKAGMDSAVDIS